MTRKPHIISGHVHEPNGRPAVGARIYFLAAPVAVADMALVTDQHGQFTLPAPASGTYQLGCTADGFAPATVTVDVAEEDARVEIELRR
ncbi:carboxypeptidase-like regulatory domain-containing protein [Hymenobacter crusticola]|uniref:Carboxypeptidase regulatory-like domain-containing protein n=1 Tax=Hymenobacter crusticola TaxID=1770526 RepID=A0A243WFW9_9BACT|nr:carboxypeptidase-like regulatory domain-containing protein [Hymenobacter crusticola]OUJ74057.1 hypothetical protein BXP70_09930 [Hymenobacter crusticola]